MFKTGKLKKLFKTKPYKADRREKTDRRSFGLSPKFPFIKTDGIVVNRDQRSRPDRRIANIQVKEHHVYFDDEQFKKDKKT